MAESDSPKAFILRVGSAVLRLVAIAVFGFLHVMLNRCLPYIVPENFRPAEVWVEDISFGAFALVYVYLLWEMIKVFIPMLHPARDYPSAEAKDEAAS